MKIVINNEHGGFGISDEAMLLYAERKGMTLYPEKNSWGTMFYTVPVEEYKKIQESDCNKSNELCFGESDIKRDDPILVQIVEELGEKAYAKYSHLLIVEVPDDVKWHIAEYDGWEHIAENHRTWPE